MTLRDANLAMLEIVAKGLDTLSQASSSWGVQPQRFT